MIVNPGQQPGYPNDRYRRVEFTASLKPAMNHTVRHLVDTGGVIYGETKEQDCEREPVPRELLCLCSVMQADVIADMTAPTISATDQRPAN